MGIIATLQTPFGENRELYVRINSAETSNHGVSSHVLFRGFLSKDAFEAGSNFMWEREIEMHIDVSCPLWVQAYDKLKLLPEFVGAIDC
jgi:hypothetical protein